MHDDDVKVSLHQKSAAERRVTVSAGNTLNKPLPEYVDADIALSITRRLLDDTNLTNHSGGWAQL